MGSFKNVLVTGGAGFIGSELVRQLSKVSAKVFAVDNLTNGKAENLEGLPETVTFVQEDIRNLDKLQPLLKETEVIFHLACLGVRHSLHAPYENHEVNAEATLKLLQAAKDSGVGRFVYVSSSEVYGTEKYVPMDEDHPTFPKTVYGGSKLAGECYTRAYYHSFGYPTVVIRPFNAYGPRCHHEGDSGEVIPKFLLRAMAGKPMVVFGDGKQTRDFTFVSDTAKAIILAGTASKAVGETINVGSGFELPVNELAEEIKSVLNKPHAEVIHDDPRPGDVLRLYSESSKALALLGFKPTVSFREGLEKLKAWYDAQQASPEELLENEFVHNWKT